MNIYEVMQYDVPRELMPQLDQDDVEKHYDVVRVKVPLSKLISSQTDRVEDKIDAIKKKIKTGKLKPIMIDREYRIVDGHHRYDACKESGVKVVPCVQVDSTLPELVQKYQHKTESRKYTREFPFIKV